MGRKKKVDRCAYYEDDPTIGEGCNVKDCTCDGYDTRCKQYLSCDLGIEVHDGEDEQVVL